MRVNVLINEIYEDKNPIITWKENVNHIHVNENEYTIEIGGKVIAFGSDMRIYNTVITKCYYEPNENAKRVYAGAGCEDHAHYDSFESMFTEILNDVGIIEGDYIEIKIDNIYRYVAIIYHSPSTHTICHDIDTYLLAESSSVAEDEREQYIAEARERLKLVNIGK